MATPEETFLKRMQLTKDEIAALDRYVGFIEQARKNPVDFIQGGSVAFTPAHSWWWSRSLRLRALQGLSQGKLLH